MRLCFSRSSFCMCSCCSCRTWFSSFSLSMEACSSRFSFSSFSMRLETHSFSSWTRDLRAAGHRGYSLVPEQTAGSVRDGQKLSYSPCRCDRGSWRAAPAPSPDEPTHSCSVSVRSPAACSPPAAPPACAAHCLFPVSDRHDGRVQSFQRSHQRCH